MDNISTRRVLVVDDELDSVEIISEALRWEGYQVHKALSVEQAIESMQTWNPHLVLLDMQMPNMDANRILVDMRSKSEYVSVLFISDDASTESVIAGLDAGADDFVVKPFDPLELLARVRTQLRIKDLNDQLRRANERLKELVDIDDLTGLYNMRSVYQRLESELERGRRFKRPVCVVMMDMDYFKSVNDGHDHLFGSYVISEVGGIIRGLIRTIDLGARYGGDEFLIMLTETNFLGAQQFCERLRKAIAARTFKHGPDQMQLTSSIGFAITIPGEMAIDAKQLVRIADHALYEAKRSGKNQVKAVEVTPEVAEASAHKQKKAG